MRTYDCRIWQINKENWGWEVKLQYGNVYATGATSTEKLAELYIQQTIDDAEEQRQWVPAQPRFWEETRGS